MSDSEDERVAAAVAGDLRAAEGLLAALLPRVRNLVRYLVRGDSDVDDIAQNALIVLLENLGSYRGVGPFYAWVDRVVTHVVFAHARRRRRDRARVADSYENAPEGATTMMVDEQFMMARQVASLLDELPLEQRQVVVLHHVLEMSVPEISAELRVPFETVRSRLRLARVQLRSRGMEGMDEDSPERGRA